MKLTKEFLKENSACSDGYKWACENLIGLTTNQVINKLIDANKINWANWYLTRLMTKPQCVQYAIFSAREVLSIFEEKYPKDDRPRKAIEAAETWLKDPSKKNAYAAYAYAAYAYAASSAASSAAADAAYASSAAASSAAASSAAASSAAADASSASSAAAYAKLKLQKKILNYGLKILKGKK